MYRIQRYVRTVCDKFTENDDEDFNQEDAEKFSKLIVVGKSVARVDEAETCVLFCLFCYILQHRFHCPSLSPRPLNFDRPLSMYAWGFYHRMGGDFGWLSAHLLSHSPPLPVRRGPATLDLQMYDFMSTKICIRRRIPDRNRSGL
jgi:hypothetical protein